MLATAAIGAVLSLLLLEAYRTVRPSEESRQLANALAEIGLVRSLNEEANETISLLEGEARGLRVQIGEVKAEAAIQQLELERQLKEQAQEVSRLSTQTLNTVTGGDSFCYFQLLSDGRLILVHHGDYPLYDVAARVVDLDRAHTMERPLTLERIHEADIDVALGTVVPGRMRVGIGRAGMEILPARGFNIFFTARNGWFTQLLRLAKVDGELRTATRVVRDGEVVFESVSEGFPVNQDGEVAW